jgi:hypothetical protein
MVASKLRNWNAPMDATPIVERFLAKDDLNGLGLAISTAYKGCAVFCRNHWVTGSFPVGIEQRAHLLRAFVDHGLMRFADEREDFTHEIRPNNARNCLHVRIYKNGLALTAHFMGRKRFRRYARAARNRELLAERNTPDLFGYEDKFLDAFKDIGYAQILHGGSWDRPVFLKLVIPTRDQARIGAHMPLPIPEPDVVVAELIREEISLKLKNFKPEEDEGPDAEATG